MTTEYKDASWAQLPDGIWGIRVPGETKEGEIVKTQTRGGKVSYETVGKIVTTETRGIYSYVIASLGPKPEVKKPKAPRKPKAPKVETLDHAACMLLVASNEEAKENARRPRADDDDDLPY